MSGGVFAELAMPLQHWSVGWGSTGMAGGLESILALLGIRLLFRGHVTDIRLPSLLFRGPRPRPSLHITYIFRFFLLFSLGARTYFFDIIWGN